MPLACPVSAAIHNRGDIRAFSATWNGTPLEPVATAAAVPLPFW